MRPDLAAIIHWVPRGARVLDLGCGDGSLLRSLWLEREAPGYGVEIDEASVLACVKNDVNVLQLDLESGLAAFAGHMPVSRELPYQWYDTPNVHHCTLVDFEALCTKLGVRVLERLVLDGGREVSFLPNLLGSLAVYRCTTG